MPVQRPSRSQRSDAVTRRAAASKRVDAVVLAAPYPNDRRISVLNDLGLPFILHGRSEGAPPHAWLDIDNAGAAERATAHLLDLGHRRIALVNGPAGMTFVSHREMGYRAAFAARNLTQEVWVDQVLDEPLAAGNYAAARADHGRVLSANLVLDL